MFHNGEKMPVLKVDKMDRFLAFFGLVRKSRFDTLQENSLSLCDHWLDYKEKIDNYIIQITPDQLKDVPIEPNVKVEDNVYHVKNFNRKF